MNDQINQSFADITDKLWGWLTAIIENLPNLGIALIVLVIAYYASKIISRTTRRIAGRYVEQEAISKLIARAVAIVVVMVGLFLALTVLNFGTVLNTILAGAGISGLVIGLAMQGTLANTFSGIVLSFRDKVRIGDWVETSGYSGEIMDINLNNFIIKEADNNMVIIPNKTIIDNAMKNYTLTTKMRMMITCGVGYDSDLDEVEILTKKTIANTFEQIEKPSDVEFYYTEFEDSSVNFLCRFWFDSVSGIEKLKAKSLAIKEIRKAFEKEGINIPFPIRTLQFDNQLDIKTSKLTEQFAKN
jgi:small conductance mechanosensitive channel